MISAGRSSADFRARLNRGWRRDGGPRHHDDWRARANGVVPSPSGMHLGPRGAGTDRQKRVNGWCPRRPGEAWFVSW